MQLNPPHRGHRIALIFLFLFIAVFVEQYPLSGLDQLPHEVRSSITAIFDIEPEPPPQPCGLSFEFVPLIHTSGLYLPNTPVVVNAASSKFYFYQPDISGGIVGCDQSLIDYNAPFNWSLDRPAGSSTVLDDAETLVTTFVPDVPGTYEITFTACIEDCAFLPMGFNHQFVIPPTATTIEIDVQEGAVPPRSEPVLPAMEHKPFTVFEDLDDKCPWITSPLANPQYVTVERWNGAEDYRLLEGYVKSSKVSRKDYYANHHVHDFLIYVRPDVQFNDLAAQHQINKGEVEVEWEFNQFPEHFRPSRGDRVSVLGYWIHDCGHDNKTEIHPPVMVAAHRARPVLLPEDLGYGSNAYVAGIVSHLWVNRNAGEITGNCSATGLVNAVDDDACLPQSEGYASNPIDREITFNIYLPDNPRNIYAEFGIDVPTPPLYYRAFNAFVEPDIVVRETEGITWLEVTLDLRDYSGDHDGMRIEAGWIYPAPHNWGLQSWELTIPSLKIHDHSDLGWPVDVGDWKLWVNTNNSAQEWTKILDCDECVRNGTKTFRKCRSFFDCRETPWKTGPASAQIENWLGPNVLLFPWQAFWLQTNGYDPDALLSDDVGTARVLRKPREGTYSERSSCSSSWDSGCGSYTVNYILEKEDDFGQAQLSRRGMALYNTYFIGRDGILIPDPPVIAWRDWNFPEQDAGSDSTFQPFYRQDFFPQQGIEESTLGGMTNEAFASALKDLEKQDPAAFETYLTNLRTEVNTSLKNRQTIGDNYLMLKRLEYAMPVAMWDTYFGDVRFPEKCPPQWAIFGLVLVLLLLGIYGVRSG